MILVVGATGTLGGEIARRLLAQGRKVCVLVRPQSPYHSLVAAGAEPAMGDLKDPASLAAACRGVEQVVTTANSAQRGGEDNADTVELHGNRSLIDAARQAGVKRFILTSAYGATPQHPAPFMAGKGMSEEHLRASGLSYTILVPNAFMEVWVWMVVAGPALAGQPVTIVGEGRRKHSFISRDDVASFAVAALDNPAARNQHLMLGGPEPLSWHDPVTIYERVLGRSIPVQHVPIDAPMPNMPEHLHSLLVGFDMYDSPIDMAELSQTFGVQLHSVEEVARRPAARE